MHLQSLVSGAAVTPGIFGSPALGHRSHSGCLTDSAAAILLDSFVSLYVDVDEGVTRSIASTMTLI